VWIVGFVGRKGREMPIVKHVLNFSELITRAASERKRLNLHQISHSERLYSVLKSSTISYEQEAQEETSREFTLPASSFYRRALYLSAFFDYFLLSSPLLILLRVTIYLTAFILIAFETEKHLSDPTIFKLQTVNYMIDIFFCVESVSKLYSYLSRLTFPLQMTSPTIFLTDGLIELATTIGSLIFGYSPGGSWFRLVRVSFLSVIAVRHAVHIDVLMVRAPPPPPPLPHSEPLLPLHLSL
jgi:hypothetical protein